MKFQAFVPDWPGPKQHGAANVRLLQPFCETFHLDNPAHYFTQQWELARSLFTGDIFVMVMADVWPLLELGRMFSEMERLFQTTSIGVYAPHVRWNPWQYNPETLSKVEEGSFEVPDTDLLCVAIRREVLEKVPHGTPEANFIGYGFDFAVMAMAKHYGWRIVRDYRFEARHPEGVTGHSRHNAEAQMWAWMDGMEPETGKVIRDYSHWAFAEQKRHWVGLDKGLYTPSPEEIQAWAR